VVGASVMREAAFALWREMGLQIVLADGYSTGRYEHLVSEFVPLDPRDGSADLAELVALARTCAGVVTLADNSQITAATVARDVGHPGIAPELADIARSKLLQRRLGSDGGLAVPRWRHVRAASDIDEFYAHHAGPAVLKPVDCAGSAGVLRVRDGVEGRRQWPVVRLMSPSHTVVIEEFVAGREVCVDAVVVGGAPAFVSVCDAEYVGPDGFIAVSATYSAVQRDRAAATAEIARIASAYGLRDGVMQAEYKVDGDRWVLLEVTFRPGGALVPDLTAMVTGVNLYEVQARLALGLSPAIAPVDPSWSAVPVAQVRFLVGTGVVRAFVPPAQIMRGLPAVRVVNQLARPGQRVRLPLSEDGRAGYAVGWGAERREVDAQLRTAIGRMAEQMGITQHLDDPPAAVPAGAHWEALDAQRA
jgi:biotin carboxylase